MSLLIRNGTILTMNDAFDVVEGDVSIRDGRIAAVGRCAEVRHDRDHRRARRLRAARLHSDARPSLPDALPRLWPTTCRCMDWLRTRVWPMEAAHTPASLRASAAWRRAELLSERHDGGADHGDRARHRRRLRGARGERPARDHRQVHDGCRRRRARAAAGADAATSIDESLASAGAVAWRGRRTAARRVCAAVCGLLLARAARSRRRRCRREHGVLVHTHASESRDEIDDRPRATGLGNMRLSGRHRPGVAAAVRRALRLGGRRGAGAARRARRQGDALPRLEPQARLGLGARGRAAPARASPSRSAPTAPPATTSSTCSRRCGWRRCCRRSGWDPARCPRATCSGWRRATARARSGSTTRSARLRSASAPT